MTDQQHPITIPPDLERELLGLWPQESLQRAAQWGADMELDACCKWLDEIGPVEIRLCGNDLRIDRRPQPKSLAEEALSALTQADEGLTESEWPSRADVIRRALERLKELEGQG